MTVTSPETHVDEIVTLLRQKYPAWAGFDDPTFESDEITYKQELVAQAKELINEAELRRLCAVHEYDEVLRRLDMLGLRTNLIYRSNGKENGDLRLMYRIGENVAGFCDLVVDLLYGPDDSPQRLGRFLTACQSLGFNANWAFPTFFLFITHPDQDIFIKPESAQRFTEFMGSPGLIQQKPNAQAYAAYLQIIRELRSAMQTYRPRDMVDIQSVVWCCGEKLKPATTDLGNMAEKMVTSLRKWYPDLSAAEFARDCERRYKVAAVDKARETLSLAELTRLSQAGDYDEIIQRFSEFRKHATARSMLDSGSLSYGYGDLYPLMQETIDKPTFCAAMVDLLYGEGESPDRLQRFLTYCEEHQVKLNWPFPTFFLYLCHPETDFLIKPRMLKCLLDFFGIPLSPPARPDAEFYRQVLMIVAALHEQMQAYGTFDRLDLLGQMNLCYVILRKETKPTDGEIVSDPDMAEQRYWKISPGANGSIWPQCQKGGFIALGWSDLGNIEPLTREDFEKTRDEAIRDHTGVTGWTKDSLEQVWTFVHDIKIGDMVIANQGTARVLGIGRVIDDFTFVEEDEDYPNRRAVEWVDVTPRKINEGNWRRTLLEVSKERFEHITEGSTDVEIVVDPDAAFTKEAFALLSMLEQTPTMVCYHAHEEAFREQVIGPFQTVFREAIQRLPRPFTERMETEKNLFSRVPKNDYGQGGAWSHYWGALSLRGMKKTESAQLLLWMNHEYLECGFTIGHYADEVVDRFQRNCQRHRHQLALWLGETLSPDVFTMGSATDDDGELLQPLTFTEWLNAIDRFGFRITRQLLPDEVLQHSKNQLCDVIAQTFQQLYPFILLATEDEPLPMIARYLGVDETEEEDAPTLQPDLPLDTIAGMTGFDVSLLERWVQSIHRKKQAILYGPPGTGKTFLAELLAKHLISGGDGFCELVQFHPAYAYEDFIQGIRPRTRPDGSLEYPMIPGRFLDFCAKAARHTDPCVLIIDEINRANLSRVFGELMYLLEYRDQVIPLAGGGTLAIPANVRLLGAMNTADRSIALVDHALRRRFAFLSLAPNYEALRRFHARHAHSVEGLVKVLEALNKEINDAHYAVGISFFMRERLSDELEDIWRMEIEPYLDEYFCDRPERIDPYRWDRIREKVLA